MSDLHLWMQAWSYQGEKMRAIVEGSYKLDNNAIASDCSDDEVRSIEASLHQVLHRTTANEPLRVVQQARGQRIRSMACNSEEMRSEKHVRQKFRICSVDQ